MTTIGPPTDGPRTRPILRLVLWMILVPAVILMAAATIKMGNQGIGLFMTPGLFCGLTLIAWLLLSTPSDAIRMKAAASLALLLTAGAACGLAAVMAHPTPADIIAGILSMICAVVIAVLLHQRSASPWWLCLYLFHPLILGRIVQGHAWTLGFLLAALTVFSINYLLSGKPHSRLWGNIAVIAALCSPGAIGTMAIFPLALCVVEWNVAGWLISLLGGLCINTVLPGWLYWCLYAICILTAVWQIGGDLLNPPTKSTRPQSG